MLSCLADKVVIVTPPVAISDNAAVTTAEIDTKGYGWARYLIVLGATDIALAACKVTESDSAGSGHADITGADFSVSPATLASATADNTVLAVCVNLKGRKRYLDLTLTAGDGTAGTFVAVLCELGRAADGPQTAAQQGFGQRLIV
jgi:hypothetical protein